jgi:hypothetical protein
MSVFGPTKTTGISWLDPRVAQFERTNTMEGTTRRRGRPPGPTQTLPIFLHQVRSGVRQEIIISGFMVRELRAYVVWAARLTMMAPDEVMVRTVDHC